MDADRPAPDLPEIGPDDFYMDGPNMVFTAAYHLKRGYCCGSGCRHCPYATWTPAAPEPPAQEC